MSSAVHLTHLNPPGTHYWLQPNLCRVRRRPLLRIEDLTHVRCQRNV